MRPGIDGEGAGGFRAGRSKLALVFAKLSDALRSKHFGQASIAVLLAAQWQILSRLVWARFVDGIHRLHVTPLSPETGRKCFRYLYLLEVIDGFFPGACSALASSQSIRKRF